jgi:hypothetical protein
MPPAPMPQPSFLPCGSAAAHTHRRGGGLPARAARTLAAASIALAAMGCSKAEEAPAAPPPPPQVDPTPQVAAPMDAARAIYTAIAQNLRVAGFDRTPYLSSSYIEEGPRRDAFCRDRIAGRDTPPKECVGDPVLCTLEPLRPSATRLDGEQPGRSATVVVTLGEGAKAVTAIANLVVEDGEWKIDNVACP